MLTVLLFYFMAMSQETIRQGILVPPGPTGAFTSDICLSCYFLFILWLCVSRQWGMHFGPTWSHMRIYWWHLITVLLFIYFMAMSQQTMRHGHFGPTWSHRRICWWHLLTVLHFIYFKAMSQQTMRHGILVPQAPLMVTFANRSTFFISIL
jgi:hypothetical protein